MDSRNRDQKRRRVEQLSSDKRSGDRASYRNSDNKYYEFDSAYKQDNLPNFYPNKIDAPIEKWLRNVEDARKVNNWSESTTVHYALNKLKGSAETWYKSLPLLKLSWEEWKDKLIQAFPSTKDYYGLLEDMVNRKKLPDETYSKYFFDKLALVNLCKITGRDSVACIIGGLSEEIKPSVRIGNFKEPEELYEYLLTLNTDKDSGARNSYQKRDPKESRAKNTDNYRDAVPKSSYKGKEMYKEKDSKGSYREKDYRDNYKEREPRPVYNDKGAVTSYREKDLKDFYREKDSKMDYRDKEFRDGYLERDSRASYSVNLKETDLRLTLGEKCYSCGGTGHYAKYCPRFKEIVYCKYCYRTGHTEDQCYDRNMLI